MGKYDTRRPPPRRYLLIAFFIAITAAKHLPEKLVNLRAAFFGHTDNGSHIPGRLRRRPLSLTTTGAVL